MPVIVDTNVLVAANGQGSCPQASPSCVIACGSRLISIQQNGKIILDLNWHILNEYKQNVSESGQPGVGDRFLKWVLLNWRNPGKCDLVKIHQLPEGSFKEFPIEPGLESFDPADRKFVAVANIHSSSPPILVAMDDGWQKHESALKTSGITVEFLCPDVLGSNL